MNSKVFLWHTNLCAEIVSSFAKVENTEEVTNSVS